MKPAGNCQAARIVAITTCAQGRRFGSRLSLAEFSAGFAVGWRIGRATRRLSRIVPVNGWFGRRLRSATTTSQLAAGCVGIETDFRARRWMQADPQPTIPSMPACRLRGINYSVGRRYAPRVGYASGRHAYVHMSRSGWRMGGWSSYCNGTGRHGPLAPVACCQGQQAACAHLGYGNVAAGAGHYRLVNNVVAEGRASTFGSMPAIGQTVGAHSRPAVARPRSTGSARSDHGLERQQPSKSWSCNWACCRLSDRLPRATAQQAGLHP